MLRNENEELKDEMLRDDPVGAEKANIDEKNHNDEPSERMADPKRLSDYQDLSQTDLISLVVSYDDKVKALSSELGNISKIRETAATKAAEKDRYKALARRLKEERNQYKDRLDEKV